MLLDPFCGAGTILAEAGLTGFAVLGGDTQSNALRAARENLGHAGVNARVWQGQRSCPCQITRWTG